MSNQSESRGRPETSGFLMSIVRTLSSSADYEQRESEKSRIEKSFHESDKNVGELVTANYEDLGKILQSFSTISKRITDSRDKIKTIKDDLISCKTLLHCKRDELRRLWIEGLEHKTIVAMLDQIEEIKEVPDKLDDYMAKKHYLHATDLIVNAVAKLEGPLAGVDALRDLRMDLHMRKEQLHEVLIDELNRQIYIKVASSVVKSLQRQQSSRGIRRELSLAPTNNSENQAGNAADKAIKRPFSRSMHGGLPFPADFSIESAQQPRQITEDLNSHPEDNLPQFIAILVESLYVLRKLPEAVEATKQRIQPELLAIVTRTSQHVADSASIQQGENLMGLDQPRYLLELLELVFQQFRCVATMHKLVLCNLKRIMNVGPRGDIVQLYDMVDVWARIQAVLQLLLGDYLDVRNAAGSHQQSHGNFDEPSTDIAVYFAKKRPPKPKKLTLFRFDASSHAISMNSYLREQRHYDPDEILGGHSLVDIGKPQFVCKPGATNITAVFNPLQFFIKEIELAIGCSSGASSLQAFVTDFVKSVFLGQVHYQVTSSIHAATKDEEEEESKVYHPGSSNKAMPRPSLAKLRPHLDHVGIDRSLNSLTINFQKTIQLSGLDALRVIVDYKTQRDLGVPRPLLQSTVTVDRNIQELRDLMHDLPDYADQFLNMICKVLQDYCHTCHSAYRGIVQYDSDEKRIISAMWAKDEDINRFLRSLPSWRSLQPTEDQELNRTICSDEEMRALNSKESVILISNLAEALIPQQEIITDVTQMRTVANLHESLEWFAGRLRTFASSLSPKNVHNLSPSPLQLCMSELPPVSEKTLESLYTLAQNFQDLAEVCLLLLHLEVRVHCFYYLLPVAKQSNYAGAIDDMDPDSNVLKLNKDLSTVEEVLTQSLQPRKFKYIFENLGYLVASILINNSQFLKKVNENGIKKMCRNIFAIQQNLTNITQSREADMDHARLFYEMLYMKPDEILHDIAENGAQFSLQDYCHMLGLIHRSHPSGTPTVLNSRFQKLRDIMDIKSQEDTISSNC